MTTLAFFRFLRKAGGINGDCFSQDVVDGLLRRIDQSISQSVSQDVKEVNRIDCNEGLRESWLNMRRGVYLHFGLGIVEMDKKAVQSVVENRSLQMLLRRCFEERGKRLAGGFAHNVVAVIQTL